MGGSVQWLPVVWSPVRMRAALGPQRVTSQSRVTCVSINAGAFRFPTSLEDSLSSAFPPRIPHTYFFSVSVNGNQLSQVAERFLGFFHVFFVFPRNALCLVPFPSREGPVWLEQTEVPAEFLRLLGGRHSGEGGQTGEQVCAAPRAGLHAGNQAAKMAGQSGVRGPDE